MLGSTGVPAESRVRLSDILSLKKPTWAEVAAREYPAWDCEHLLLDSANRATDENVRLIGATL